MRVGSLSVRGFRNLAEAELELGEGIVVVHGPNGAGKSSLLEALYAALSGRSSRTNRLREVVAFGAEVARAEATVIEGSERRLLALGVSHAEGRRHTIDGREHEPVDAALRPALVVFTPERLGLVKGPPQDRRRHLDALGAALHPSRTPVRRRYGAALAQRNALLGRIRGGLSARSALDSWDAELAAAGIELVELRGEAAAAIAGPFAEACEALGLSGGATVEYRPRSPARSADELIGELGERRDSDIERGHSGHGPHLDELAFVRGSRSLRRYGSQGEQRLTLLALLLAEREALAAARPAPPLMLLDDVMSELDAEHRELLASRLAGGGQALITATDRELVPGPAGSVEIASGTIAAMVAA